VFFLYGGIESDAKTGNVAPNNDIYIMRMGPQEAKWFKESCNSEDKPIARTQHLAVPCPINDKDSKVFMFGGHHDPKTRLNDTWFFNVKELEWH
jgi:hypothetical protein